MTEQHLASDEAEVRALYNQFLDGWNRGSGTAFAAPFTDEVTFIGFDGNSFTTRSEVADFHQPLFDKWLKGTRLFGDLSVRFLSPDVALLVGRGGTIMRGKTRPDRVRDSIQTLTAVRTAEGWRLTSFQNTRLRPMSESGVSTLLWLLTDLLWKVFHRPKKRPR
ncbi:SgcJ/EcaC family oxidoreductase [Kribbella sp. NPDC023855]|uniref:SgcJ/EcaC family oxidoreductase n=1 Tax=Kribbella sp. NPDC023855 TaxID=3154698 RepID=UPI0033CAEB89